MRTFIIVVLIIIAAIYLGGAVNVGSRPLFAHIDSLIGAHVFMRIHYGLFFLIYRGEAAIESGLDKADEDIQDFSERPIGIDKKKKYRQLDEAAQE